MNWLKIEFNRLRNIYILSNDVCLKVIRFNIFYYVIYILLIKLKW